ncbi:MAG: hypothetical protein J0G94_17480 [Sphingomonadales bacterium]|nr:hypothetical protein [Sphingomonadales bacterium]
MIVKSLRAGLVSGMLLFAHPAQAGIFADDLTRCLVKATTVPDQIGLMQWLFSAISANPSISSMARVTEAERAGYNEKAVALIERLVMTDCRKEAVAALRNEGPGTIELAFRTVGEVAMRGLMSDPKTSAAMGAIGKAASEEKWSALAKEAGLAPPKAQ